jgi:predicted regulator of Ras-like GTPase activity (Roadblock/LC7/MglB family)
MEKDLILQKEDLRQLNLLLTKIVDKARIDCAILINKSGRMVTSQSETSEYDKTSLAALISGNFASSSSIANLLDENEFTSMLQEGENRHIYIAQVDNNSILACIFDKRTNAEKIKFCVEELSSKLTNVLSKIYNNILLDPELNIDISEKLNFS